MVSMHRRYRCDSSSILDTPINYRVIFMSKMTELELTEKALDWFENIEETEQQGIITKEFMRRFSINPNRIDWGY